jgi:hypothetical protein
VIKDALLIVFSTVVMHTNAYSSSQALGYAVALFGVYAFLEYKKNPEQFEDGLVAGMYQR